MLSKSYLCEKNLMLYTKLTKFLTNSSRPNRIRSSKRRVYSSTPDDNEITCAVFFRFLLILEPSRFLG